MLVQKILKNVVLFLMILGLSTCVDLKETAQEFSNVFQASVALQKYYQVNQALPATDSELERFCQENQIDLNLTRFSSFTYTMSGDSAISMDYALKGGQKIKGNMIVRIE